MLSATSVAQRPAPAQQWHGAAAKRLQRPRARVLVQRPQALPPGLLLGDISFESLAAFGINEEVVLLMSVVFSTASLALNYQGGVATEKQRAELQRQLDREKQQRERLAEIQGVIARYRGPLLESAIDFEQPLFHLATDGRCGGGAEAGDCPEATRYLLYTAAQFLGFLEVMRREGPRERAFLQAGNPHGADTLQTLVEGIRFVLCASNAGLEKWHAEGRGRPHPGARRRPPPGEVLRECQDAAAANGGSAGGGQELLRVSRGFQRAIGSHMITTPMGAERHYTRSYADFCQRLDSDPELQRWFTKMTADCRELATGTPWQGERAFPVGRWTRVLLLQQLLVELFDLLDPDCVRLPLARRTRLQPTKWGPLPNIESYTAQLKELSSVDDYGRGKEESPLEGIRDLLLSVTHEEVEPAAAPAAAAAAAAVTTPGGARQRLEDASLSSNNASDATSSDPEEEEGGEAVSATTAAAVAQAATLQQQAPGGR